VLSFYFVLFYYLSLNSRKVPEIRFEVEILGSITCSKEMNSEIEPLDLVMKDWYPSVD
jgi:hypothetical protein